MLPYPCPDCPLPFKPVTLESMGLLAHYLRLAPSLSSSFSLGVVLLWAKDYDLHYYEADETLIFCGTSAHHHHYFSYPLGKNPEQLLAKLPKPYTLLYVDKAYLPAFPEAAIHPLENDADYVYLYEDLIALRGKSKASYRNHINRFNKDYPTCHYERLTMDNIRDAYHILDAQTCSNPGKADDAVHCRQALDHLAELPFTGGILYANGAAVAFSLGEVIRDMLFVEFEKRIDGYEGAPDVNRWEFLHLFAEQGIRYVNREEDVGDPGLRMAKQRMGPCFMIEKYRIDVH